MRKRKHFFYISGDIVFFSAVDYNVSSDGQILRRGNDMLYQITDGTVSAGGTLILSHINFEIKGTEKIAVVGKNGAGKTTLLRLIAGEISLDRDDKREGPGCLFSRRVTIGMLSQSTVSPAEREQTVEEIFMGYGPAEEDFSRERFLEEAEFDRIFTGFGFEKAEKKRRFSSFSGGEQTKIALIRLLLMKPDILLLDEPTNHLDMPCVEWLEEYLRNYEKAAVFVSHDRFFLDRTADVVYELSRGRLTRYPGNYTHYREQKRKNYALQIKRCERQEKEQKRLEELVERFKHKPNKAGFARAKKTILQRLEQVEKPEKDEARIFTGELIPAVPGSKWVFEAKHLKIGYDRELLELSLRIRRGQKIGIIGNNGAGKTTFLKTAAGQLRPLGGTCSLGNQITLGYFDQHSAELESNQSVLKHFHDLFPGLTEKEARSRLGAYLFGGRGQEKPSVPFPEGKSPGWCWRRFWKAGRISSSWTSQPTTWISRQRRRWNPRSAPIKEPCCLSPTTGILSARWQIPF